MSITLSVLVWIGANEFVTASATTSLSPADSHPEIQVILNINTRRFQPQKLTLHSGQKIRLVLRNLDAELHAFVPIGLFTGSNLNISGNGAPEFGPEGFRRVLLPSNGQTEILFIPQRPGSYPFICDLPGHIMNGTIVVDEQEAMVQ